MNIFLMVLEIIGTVSFAVSGAITGLKKGMDVFGITVLGATTAVGGGIMRDILLGITPPAAFRDPRYMIIAIVSSVLIFIAQRKQVRMDGHKVYDVLLKATDSIGLGAFTVCGMNAAIEAGACDNYFLLVFVGVITGVGGGVIRDVLAGDMPYIFVKHVYASAAIIGAVVFVILHTFAPYYVSLSAGLVTIIVLRACSIKFKWNLPRIK
ncbi:MAG: trimeric intracellular cation channel family protein [Firmicutes bacterium]|nr:trimeric intracellular cation channel family protein [Bacillota bacterium]